MAEFIGRSNCDQGGNDLSLFSPAGNAPGPEQ